MLIGDLSNVYGDFDIYNTIHNIIDLETHWCWPHIAHIYFILWIKIKQTTLNVQWRDSSSTLAGIHYMNCWCIINWHLLYELLLISLHKLASTSDVSFVNDSFILNESLQGLESNESSQKKICSFSRGHASGLAYKCRRRETAKQALPRPLHWGIGTVCLPSVFFHAGLCQISKTK